MFAKKELCNLRETRSPVLSLPHIWSFYRAFKNFLETFVSGRKNGRRRTVAGVAFLAPINISTWLPAPPAGGKKIPVTLSPAYTQLFYPRLVPAHYRTKSRVIWICRASGNKFARCRVSNATVWNSTRKESFNSRQFFLLHLPARIPVFPFRFPFFVSRNKGEKRRSCTNANVSDRIDGKLTLERTEISYKLLSY